jgi:hypothetical protein
MKNFLKIRSISAMIAVLTSLLLFSGCATIIDGSTSTLTFSSNVDGVRVLLNGGEIGMTPFQGEIPKPDNTSTQFTFRKDGYETTTITVGRKIVPLTIVSIIFWDLGTTDFLTGNAFTYSRNAIYVEMRPLKVAAADEALYESQAAMRKFVLQNYDDVYHQVQSGEGEYFGYIAESLEVNEAEYPELQASLSKSLTKEDMVGFAKFVAAQVK